MNHDLLTKTATALVERKGYKGSRDSLFTLLLIGGALMANEVRHDVADIKRDMAHVKARTAAVEAENSTIKFRLTALEQNHRP